MLRIRWWQQGHGALSWEAGASVAGSSAVGPSVPHRNSLSHETIESSSDSGIDCKSEESSVALSLFFIRLSCFICSNSSSSTSRTETNDSSYSSFSSFSSMLFVFWTRLLLQQRITMIIATIMSPASVERDIKSQFILSPPLGLGVGVTGQLPYPTKHTL